MLDYSPRIGLPSSQDSRSVTISSVIPPCSEAPALGWDGLDLTWGTRPKRLRLSEADLITRCIFRPRGTQSGADKGNFPERCETRRRHATGPPFLLPSAGREGASREKEKKRKSR